jgi:hypothetical protein
MSKHVIVYSHGFGVRKDDRGLLTDIAKSMPGVDHVLFDYNFTGRYRAHMVDIVKQEIENA